MVGHKLCPCKFRILLSLLAPGSKREVNLDRSKFSEDDLHELEEVTELLEMRAIKAEPWFGQNSMKVFITPLGTRLMQRAMDIASASLLIEMGVPLVLSGISKLTPEKLAEAKKEYEAMGAVEKENAGPGTIDLRKSTPSFTKGEA